MFVFLGDTEIQSKKSFHTYLVNIYSPSSVPHRRPSPRRILERYHLNQARSSVSLSPSLEPNTSPNPLAAAATAAASSINRVGSPLQQEQRTSDIARSTHSARSSSLGTRHRIFPKRTIFPPGWNILGGGGRPPPSNSFFINQDDGATGALILNSDFGEISQLLISTQTSGPPSRSSTPDYDLLNEKRNEILVKQPPDFNCNKNSPVVGRSIGLGTGLNMVASGAYFADVFGVSLRRKQERFILHNCLAQVSRDVHGFVGTNSMIGAPPQTPRIGGSARGSRRSSGSSTQSSGVDRDRRDGNRDGNGGSGHRQGRKPGKSSRDKEEKKSGNSGRPSVVVDLLGGGSGLFQQSSLLMNESFRREEMCSSDQRGGKQRHKRPESARAALMSSSPSAPIGIASSSGGSSPRSSPRPVGSGPATGASGSATAASSPPSNPPALLRLVKAFSDVSISNPNVSSGGGYNPGSSIFGGSGSSAGLSSAGPHSSPRSSPEGAKNILRDGDLVELETLVDWSLINEFGSSGGRSGRGGGSGRGKPQVTWEQVVLKFPRNALRRKKEKVLKGGFIGTNAGASYNGGGTMNSAVTGVSYNGGGGYGGNGGGYERKFHFTKRPRGMRFIVRSWKVFAAEMGWKEAEEEI